MRVRITVSAPNAGALWDLQCAVREGMVLWLQRSQSGALPRWRFEPASGDTVAPRRHTENGTAANESGLFSGSDEAEQRGRAFDDSGEDARELIKEQRR